MKISIKIKSIFISYYNRLINKGQEPIFILGTGRCGSTLLVDILATNPDIQIDQNEQYDWFLLALYDGLGKHHQPMYTDLINYKLTAKKSIARWTPYYRTKLRIMIDRKINQNNKVFFLKSPAVTFILPELKKLYPKAKYIHLYRNGFAVSRSWFKKNYFKVKEYQDNYTEEEFILECAKYYNDSILSIDDFFKTIQIEKQFSLSYEDLTKNPEVEISKILDFSEVEDKCDFDLSTIKSANYKIDELEDKLKAELKEIMKDSLETLGYN